MIAESFSSTIVGRIQPFVFGGLSPASPTHGYSIVFADGRHVHFARLVYILCSMSNGLMHNEIVWFIRHV